ncbi:membrane protein [Sporosarcina sp. NCCP-2716]|uniref:YoaK family protein n=1 Tax=Sporosarcina sp. NCCP-2716 TaxID=2943679 RepID=UPI00203DE62C|nr:YoaK family protein [Sporosarcina sp. NCCP-2716]GKV69225.1 membrane protein [Sporosarcina sp. NCCP-2716]
MTPKQDTPYVLGTGLTVLSTFLMGFIDAYTFLQQGGSFASAQTGNLVSLSAKLFSGNFKEAMGHVWVFAGFAIGAFAGEAVIERTEDKGIKRYRYYLLIQAIVLFLLAIFQNQLTGNLMLLTLGALAGYELTTFRKFRGTSVNNGIMTGNTKNLMNHLYQFVFNGDKKAQAHAADLLSTVVIFILGAGAGTLIIQLNASYNLWTAFAIALAAFAWATARSGRPT